MTIVAEKQGLRCSEEWQIAAFMNLELRRQHKKNTRMVVARGWRQRGNEELFNGYRFQFWKMKKFGD